MEDRLKVRGCEICTSHAADPYKAVRCAIHFACFDPAPIRYHLSPGISATQRHPLMFCHIVQSRVVDRRHHLSLSLKGTDFEQFNRKALAAEKAAAKAKATADKAAAAAGEGMQACRISVRGGLPSSLRFTSPPIRPSTHPSIHPSTHRPFHLAGGKPGTASSVASRGTAASSTGGADTARSATGTAPVTASSTAADTAASKGAQAQPSSSPTKESKWRKEHEAMMAIVYANKPAPAAGSGSGGTSTLTPTKGTTTAGGAADSAAGAGGDAGSIRTLTASSPASMGSLNGGGSVISVATAAGAVPSGGVVGGGDFSGDHSSNAAAAGAGDMSMASAGGAAVKKEKPPQVGEKVGDNLSSWRACSRMEYAPACIRRCVRVRPWPHELMHRIDWFTRPHSRPLPAGFPAGQRINRRSAVQGANLGPQEGRMVRSQCRNVSLGMCSRSFTHTSLVSATSPPHFPQ